LLANFKQMKEKDIILLGRSMGSGPTVHLAATRKPGAVVLVSPYTSIKNLVYERVGPLSAFVKEQFDNQSLMKEIKSPTLLIHGS